MSDIPEEFQYTREHEWIQIDGNKAIIGITDHAQRSLGDIVYIELPEIGDEIDAGDEFGNVESVKAVSSLFMPVSGRVIEVNSELDSQPELVNDDCYDTWIIRIEITNPEDLKSLLDAEEYAEFLLESED
ncbi:glycine cleavage system protein GcvH [Deltaproteobacteria bacterium TL4]